MIQASRKSRKARHLDKNNIQNITKIITPYHPESMANSFFEAF